MEQMFTQMKKAAVGWLAGRDPEEIASKAKVAFDGSAFRFMSLGKQITVTYPDYAITPQLPPWHQLTILHYFHLADGSPLTGEWLSFGQYKSGMIRGGDFDRRAELFFRTLDIALLKKRYMELGGICKNAQADLCVEFPFLPMYPIMLNFWQADDEFPASGRLMVDASASHYLTIEDAVTVGELLLENLKRGKSYGF